MDSEVGNSETYGLEPELNSTDVNEEDRVICKLSDNAAVVVHDVGGTTLVSIGEFKQIDGKYHPTPKAISMAAQEWESFKRGVPAIQEAVIKMKSKLSALALQKSNILESKRFDGKDYHSWAEQMVSTLRELGLEHVLFEPCPSIRQSKATFKEWKQDDLGCRLCILGGLCDDLYHLHSRKTTTAKQLWDNLGSIYHDGETSCAVHKHNPLEIARFDGKNYLLWAEQMQSMLKHFQMEHLLSEPCPRSEAPDEKWMHADFACRYYMLSALRDDLLHHLDLKKVKTAKQLWDEIKSVYNDG